VAEICRRLLGTGDYVLAVATLSAGIFILVFAEILPKVIGADVPGTDRGQRFVRAGAAHQGHALADVAHQRPGESHPAA
jgi:hypothetical protein